MLRKNFGNPFRVPHGVERLSMKSRQLNVLKRIFLVPAAVVLAVSLTQCVIAADYDPWANDRVAVGSLDIRMSKCAISLRHVSAPLSRSRISASLVPLLNEAVEADAVRIAVSNAVTTFIRETVPDAQTTWMGMRMAWDGPRVTNEVDFEKAQGSGAGKFVRIFSGGEGNYSSAIKFAKYYEGKSSLWYCVPEDMRFVPSERFVASATKSESENLEIVRLSAEGLEVAFEPGSGLVRHCVLPNSINPKEERWYFGNNVINGVAFPEVVLLARYAPVSTGDPAVLYCRVLVAESIKVNDEIDQSVFELPVPERAKLVKYDLNRQTIAQEIATAPIGDFMTHAKQMRGNMNGIDLSEVALAGFQMGNEKGSVLVPHSVPRSRLPMALIVVNVVGIGALVVALFVIKWHHR